MKNFITVTGHSVCSPARGPAGEARRGDTAEQDQDGARNIADREVGEGGLNPPWPYQLGHLALPSRAGRSPCRRAVVARGVLTGSACPVARRSAGNGHRCGGERGTNGQHTFGPDHNAPDGARPFPPPSPPPPFFFWSSSSLLSPVFLGRLACWQQRRG